jgi:arabinofuranosyltransferase
VFNTGQRVEAFTGPLWVALLAFADLVTPIRLEWLAVLMGLALSGMAVVFAMLGARLLVRRDHPEAFLVPFGALVIAAIPPMWFFATSGLETGLSFAWLGACVWILAWWTEGSRRLTSWQAALLGLGWLVRPEFALFSAAFVLIVLVGQWRDDTTSDRLKFVGAALALPFAYQIFRMGYYGSLVANTAIAKEGTVTRWNRGWQYFFDFVKPYWLAVPLVLVVTVAYVPLILSARKRRDLRSQLVVFAFTVAAVLNIVYVVAIGGDYIHARLFLPALFALCAPAMLIALPRREIGPTLLVTWALICALSLRPAEDHTAIVRGGIILGGSFPNGKITADDSGWGARGPYQRWYTGPAYYFQTNAFFNRFARIDIPLSRGVRTPVVAMEGIGLDSYALGNNVNVIDLLGLADPLDSHFRLNQSLGFLHLSGHEKLLPPAWLAARLTPPGSNVNADDFTSSTYVQNLMPLVHGKDFDIQVAWARAALQCPAIRRLMNAADAPLTPAQFFSSLFNAASNATVRIPADPETAYHTFCGPGTPAEVQAIMTGPSG